MINFRELGFSQGRKYPTESTYLHGIFNLPYLAIILVQFRLGKTFVFNVYLPLIFFKNMLSQVDPL